MSDPVLPVSGDSKGSEAQRGELFVAHDLNTIAAKVAADAEERLNSRVRQLIWIFGLALVVATIGGWFKFSDIVADRVQEATRDATEPFKRLRDETSDALGRSRVDLERVKAETEIMRADYKKMQVEYGKLKEFLAVISRNNTLQQVGNKLRAIEQLQPESRNLIRLQQAVFKDHTNTEVSAILPHPGFWGAWTDVKYCPTNQYVCGVRARVERERGNGDDTALNAVELKCCLF